MTLAYTTTRYLGQADAEDLSQLSFAGDQLHQIRDRLLQVDAIIRRSPAAAREVGRETIQAWQRYSSLVATYQGFRVALGFEAEPGLSGLGATQLVIAGVGLVAFVGLLLALATAVGFLLERAMRAAQTEQALSSAVAQQTGAPAGTSYRSVTTSSGQVILVPAQQNFFDWILANPGTVLLGILGVFVIVKLVD